MVDSLKGAYDAAVKQYTANQGQDNADRTFGLQVAQLKQQADQHAQTIAMEYAKINASKKNAKEQVSPYSEANQKEAGKLSADSLFNPAARANRVAAEAKNLLPEYQGILTRNSTAARNAREAAEKEIQRQDDIVIAAMKDAQIPK
jgi:small-conductance mechanosensitive channel